MITLFSVQTNLFLRPCLFSNKTHFRKVEKAGNERQRERTSSPLSSLPTLATSRRLGTVGMSDEDVISLSDPDSEGKNIFQVRLTDKMSCNRQIFLCSKNAFLGMAGGVLMMLVSRRRPWDPASTGKER